MLFLTTGFFFDDGTDCRIGCGNGVGAFEHVGVPLKNGPTELSRREAGIKRKSEISFRADAY